MHLGHPYNNVPPFLQGVAFHPKTLGSTFSLQGKMHEQ
jgi:hypothetical protein